MLPSGTFLDSAKALNALKVVSFCLLDHPGCPGAASVKVLELLVPLCPSEEDVHPDPHCLLAGSGEGVLPVQGLHDEGGSLTGCLRLLVIHVHLGDRVEVDAALRFTLQDKTK